MPKSFRQVDQNRKLQALRKCNRIRRNLLIDVDCSEEYAVSSFGKPSAYCLTASRGARQGPFIYNKGRRFDRDELSWLQGIDNQAEGIGKTLDKEKISDGTWGKMMGNSTTLSTAERCMRAALIVVGLLPADWPDRWADTTVQPKWCKQ